MINPQLFTNKLNEIYELGKIKARTALEQYVDENQLAKIDEEDDLSLYELFGLKYLLGSVEGMMYYFPADEIRRSLGEMYDCLYRESLKNKKPVLKENLESSMCENAKEKFCILMDWDVTPEDIKSCFIVDDIERVFRIILNNGEKYLYYANDDCMKPLK